MTTAAVIVSRSTSGIDLVQSTTLPLLPIIAISNNNTNNQHQLHHSSTTSSIIASTILNRIIESVTQDTQLPHSNITDEFKSNDNNYNDIHHHLHHHPRCPHCSQTHHTKLNISTNISAIDDIKNKIMKNEHCIFWYFGARGLTKECTKFYAPILKYVYDQNSMSYLLDLKACRALSDGNAKYLNDKNRFTNNIQQISNNKIHPICVSDIYQKLSEITETKDSQLYTFINNVLCRNELLSPSQKHMHILKHNNNNNIMTDVILFGSVFNCNKFVVLSALQDRNIVECYSIMQYIELLFIVDKIIKKEKRNLNNTSITIKFILPNDEYKYYIDLNNRIQSIKRCECDINTFLNLNNKEIKIKFSINISIECFKFGDKIEKDRPYIFGRGFKKTKKCLSSQQLFLQQISNQQIMNTTTLSKRKQKKLKKKKKNKKKKQQYKNNDHDINHIIDQSNTINLIPNINHIYTRNL